MGSSLPEEAVPASSTSPVPEGEASSLPEEAAPASSTSLVPEGDASSLPEEAAPASSTNVLPEGEASSLPEEEVISKSEAVKKTRKGTAKSPKKKAKVKGPRIPVLSAKLENSEQKYAGRV